MGYALTALTVQFHPPWYAVALAGVMAGLLLRDTVKQQTWVMLYTVMLLVLVLTSLATTPW